MSEQEEVIYDALWEHASIDRHPALEFKDVRWACRCGELIDDDPSGRAILHRHKRHQARVLAELTTPHPPEQPVPHAGDGEGRAS